MKKVFYFTMVMTACFACKKSDDTVTAKASSQNGNIISTKWELRKSEGGIGGTMNYLPGNGITIEFYGTDSFKTVNPMSSVIYRDSGTFTITPANNPGDYNLTKFHINNGYPYTQYDSIRFVGTQLVFLAHNGWADEPTDYYEKQ